VATPEVFVNLASGAEEAERVGAGLARVCERFLARSPRLAGWLPRSPRVHEACRAQAPFALARTRGGAPTPEQEALGRLARRVERLCGRRESAVSGAQPWSPR
jgi:hypothetical protein